MKKTSIGLLAGLIVAGTFGLTGVANAEGNAYGKNTNPGNSAYGRSHNPHFAEKFTMDDATYRRLEAIIERLRARLAALSGQTGSSTAAEVEVISKAAESVDEDSAKLLGSVDLEDSEDADVWFQYGLKSTQLTKKTPVAVLTDDGSFDRTLTGLLDDTTYYYRAVARDDGGMRDYGAVLSFTTGEQDEDDQDDEHPTAETESVDDITDDTAELRGSVAMNDFEDGRVFFVYGQDEDLVEDAEDATTFDDIDEESDDLQKEAIENSFDGDDDFVFEAEDLDADTQYYFRIGVEYEDGDEEKLVFGEVLSFTTD